MKKFSKFFWGSVLISPFLIIFAVTIPNPTPWKDLGEFIGAICDLIFYIGLVIVPLMIVISGVMFIFAKGEPQKIAQARDILFWALIGGLIVLFARGIASIIEYFLGSP